MTSIVSVAAFADNETRRGITQSDRARQAILKKCYATPGYDALPLVEKNQLYDRLKQARQRMIDFCHRGGTIDITDDMTADHLEEIRGEARYLDNDAKEDFYRRFYWLREMLRGMEKKNIPV